MKTKGFSLIELLIVSSLILVITAIALPNLLRSRMAAHEASATATLKVLNTAEITYSSTYNSGFTDTLAKLGPPTSGQPSATSADLADSVLSGGAVGGTPTSFVKNGFNFTYTFSGGFGSIVSYTVNADPVARGTSGQRSFLSDQTAVIRANATAPATASDSPI